MLKDSNEKNRNHARETLTQIGIFLPVDIQEHCIESIFQMISQGEDISHNSVAYLALTSICMEESLFFAVLTFLTKLATEGTTILYI